MNGAECPLCQGKLVVRWEGIVESETGDRFEIRRCDACGLGVTCPIPEELDRYYSVGYHGGRHGITAAMCDRRRVRIVAREKPATGRIQSEQQRLLDVGCGDGTFLRAAQRAGWQVAGVERYPERARSLGLTIFTSLAEAGRAGGYDCVTLWHVLEHWSDPQQAVSDIHRLLKPGGLLLIAVPDAGSWQARCFGSHWLHLDVPRHAFHFTTQSLMLLLEQQHLIGRRLRGTEFEYDMMGWAQSALNQFSGRKNVFFKLLTGRDSGAGWLTRWVHLAVGGTLMGCAALPVWLAGCLGRGGTILAAATRADDGCEDTMHVS